MSKSYYIQVETTNITSLLMNRRPYDGEDPKLNPVIQVNMGSDDTPRQEASPKLYCDNVGPFFPGDNLFAAIVDAGQFHKIKTKKMTTAKASLVPAYVAVIEDALPIYVDGERLGLNDWEVDIRHGFNPATGGGVWIKRPRFDRWELRFTLLVDELPEKLIRELVDDAGKKVGLGDFRPTRRGRFGKFVVTKWKKVSELPKAA